MIILSITKQFPDKVYSHKEEVEYIAFIHPFYAGDNLHECVIKFRNNSSLKDSIDNDKRLINYNRKDIEQLEFDTYNEAKLYAETKAFNYDSIA